MKIAADRLTSAELIGLGANHEDDGLKAALLPGVFALDIGGKPTLTFEAKNLREAWEVCHEAWLKDDIRRLRSNTLPLWDGKARIRARYASESETALH